MRNFSAIFLILMLPVFLPVMLHAQVADGAKKLVLLQYEDLANSPWARAVDFGDRMKRLARQALPPLPRHYQTIITLAPPDEPQTFSAKYDHPRAIRIRIPGDYALIEPDTKAIARMRDTGRSWQGKSRIPGT